MYYEPNSSVSILSHFFPIFNSLPGDSPRNKHKEQRCFQTITDVPKVFFPFLLFSCSIRGVSLDIIRVLGRNRVLDKVRTIEQEGEPRAVAHTVRRYRGWFRGAQCAPLRGMRGGLWNGWTMGDGFFAALRMTGEEAPCGLRAATGSPYGGPVPWRTVCAATGAGSVAHNVRRYGGYGVASAACGRPMAAPTRVSVGSDAHIAPAFGTNAICRRQIRLGSDAAGGYKQRTRLDRLLTHTIVCCANRTAHPSRGKSRPYGGRFRGAQCAPLPNPVGRGGRFAANFLDRGRKLCYNSGEQFPCNLAAAGRWGPEPNLEHS